MKRAFLLCLCLGASAALAACDIPAAVFDGGNGGKTTTSNGGSGGASTGGGGETTTTTPMHTTTSGGAGGGGGSSTAGAGGTTTTTTTTTTLMGPTVTCNAPSLSECDPGQVCCYAPNAVTDECGPPGSCNPPTDYIEVSCDADADCAPNKKCCAYFAGDLNGNFVLQKTYCDASCDLGSQETKACFDDNDCTFPLVCLPLFTPYPEALFCLSPI